MITIMIYASNIYEIIMMFTILSILTFIFINMTIRNNRNYKDYDYVGAHRAW